MSLKSSATKRNIKICSIFGPNETLEVGKFFEYVLRQQNDCEI